MTPPGARPREPATLRQAGARQATAGTAAPAAAPAAGAVVKVDDLRKAYADLQAVDGVSFEVAAGEVFALLGPNGAGKTTTCEVLETLRRKDHGQVTILGHDLDREPDAIRARIGVLPQAFRAHDRLTCRENLAYFAAMYHARPDLDALLALVGLEEKARARYETLSGGLQQRLGIAIALVNDPELVFLDEPSTGLDPGARRQVWEVVRGLRARGKTVVLTTHYMEEAQALADRVAILNRGRIVALDAPQALIRRHAPGRMVRVRGGAGLAARLDIPGAQAVHGDLVVAVPEERGLVPVLEAIGGVESFEGLEVHASNLEDVFHQLTGEQLRTAADSGSPDAPAAHGHPGSGKGSRSGSRRGVRKRSRRGGGA